jgi:2-polyprenyl-3-methyl-5-hydroxy-6-metoxy-1,4-benzoquinol methylase
METVSCNLCGSTDYTVLYQIPDLLLDNKDELFTVVKCRRCGLLYQTPRPTQDEIGQYYPIEYEPFYQERSENWLIKKVNLYGVNKRCRIINSLPGRKRGGRLLDIGCSTGIFMRELSRSKLWEVWGNDTSEYAVKIAREQFQLHVYHGDLFQANYSAAFFDVITLWDVLEHLPDPSTTLKEISRITKPDSYIVLRIPNHDSLDSKIFGPTWAGLDLPRHFYVYSKQTIIQLLAKYEFRVKNISCNIGNYPTFVLSVRFWLTRSSYRKSVQKEVIRLLNHPISKLISAPFFYVYGLFLLGSEITVIAQKE